MKWDLEYDNHGNGSFSEWYIIRKNKTPVAQTIPRREADKKIAEHIVKCVNSHEKLTSTMRFFRGFVNGLAETNSINEEQYIIAMGKIKQALKEAS